MTAQVMFGKASVKTPARTPQKQNPTPLQATSPPQSALQSKDSQSTNPYAGRDDLNEVDFGRTFSARYAEDSSMIVVFFLWLFLGGIGMHRFYLGHKWLGTAIAGLGTFNGILLFTAGFTAIVSYFNGSGSTATSGLISAIIVMSIHFMWVFFDFFYILVRKITSR